MIATTFSKESDSGELRLRPVRHRRRFRRRACCENRGGKWSARGGGRRSLSWRYLRQCRLRAEELYSYAAHFHDAFEDSAGFGWTLPQAPSFDWATLRDNKVAEIARLNGIYGRLLDNAGVTLINGRAKVLDAHSVEIDGERISAEKILVAVGGWPWVPPFEGSELAISSNQVFDLERFPERFLVLGGGYIAVEFASIFNGLGSETHLIYRGDLFLRGFDQQVREFTRDEMGKKGVNLHFEVNIERIRQLDSGLEVTLTNGEQLEVDAVLAATGRRPHLEGLGLDTLGVTLNDDGTLKVNERFETSIPSILAIGDVTGGPELTPVALAEAMHLVAHHFRRSSGWQHPGGARLRRHCHRSLLPPQYRYRGALRRSSARALCGDPGLQRRLPTNEAHSLRQRRALSDEADRR